MELEKGEIDTVEGYVDWKGKGARKDKHGGFRAAMFTFVMMGFQNMAFVSLACNFSTYLMTRMCFDLATSATTVTNFMGTANLLCLVGALISDTYLTRLRTLIVSATIAFLGYITLAIQAHFPSLSPDCSQKEKLNSREATILFMGLYLIAIGTGGLLPSGSTLGADQFDEKDPKERKQMSSYFNWLLFSIVIGGSVGVTFLVWLETSKGKFYGAGYGISAAGILLGMICIIIGRKTYRYKVLGDSPLLRIAQVFTTAFANRKLSLPENAEELYELHNEESKLQMDFLSHTDSLRLLDKAAIVKQNSQSGNACTVTQVEETKILVRMVPIFACTIIMSTCMAQLQTFSVEQGYFMNRKLGNAEIPPSSLPIIPFVFMLIATPVYERFFIPFARRFTGLQTGITYLQRVGVGLVLSILSMSIAGIVEVHRKQYAEKNQEMSMFYLSFQYFVFGIADLFTLVGLLDFFYSQSPAGMKSLSTCFTWVSLSLGYFLSSVLVNVVNAATRHNTKSGGWLKGLNLNAIHVDLFYALLAVLSTINFVIYLFCAKSYKYRPTVKDQNQEEDNLDRKRIDTPYYKFPKDSSTQDENPSSQSMNGTPQDSNILEHSG